MTLHSVFGTAAPPGTYTRNVASSSITVGQSFYIFGPWKTVTDPTLYCVGARIYIPADLATPPASVTLYAYEHISLDQSVLDGGQGNYNMDSLGHKPNRSATIPIVLGQWNEARWEPIQMPWQGNRMLIAAQFSQPNVYLNWPTSHPDGTVAANSGRVDCNDGTGFPLAWSEQGGQHWIGYQMQGAPPTVISMNPAGYGDNTTNGYGLDILVRDWDADGDVVYVSDNAGNLSQSYGLGVENAQGGRDTIVLQGWWDGSALQAFRQVDVTPAGGTAPVRFTVTGATFSPSVRTRSGETAVVNWTVEEDGSFNTTGTSPVFNFGSAATRHVQMFVDDGAGNNRMHLVEIVNLGFDHTTDTAVVSSASATLDKTQEQVTVIEHINSLSGLVYFLCAAPASSTSGYLTGSLDFSNMSRLRYLDIYGNQVDSINLTGCSRLRRLVVENNKLTTLDLNPVRDCLEDLRSAEQRGTGYTLTALQGPMSLLWHYCVQGNTTIANSLVDANGSSNLPLCVQQWDWNTGRTGALVNNSPHLVEVRSYGNSWTSATFGNAGNLGYVELENNQLTSVTFTGATATLHYIDLSNNLLTQTSVDNVLVQLDNLGGSGGARMVNVGGTGNAAPSATGQAAAANLQGKGWTVTTNAATDTTAPSAPTNLAAGTITDTAVQLSWTASTDNVGVTGYRIYSSGTQVGTATGTSYTVSALTANTQYTFTVRARDAAGNESADSNSVTVTTALASGNSWTDNFDRADATGLAAVGNGWSGAPWGVTEDASIVSNDLVCQWSGYGGLLNNAGGNLPADFTITVTLDHAYVQSYWGIVGRVDPANTDGTTQYGVRVFFDANNTTLTVGMAGAFNYGNITLTNDNAFPASWQNAGSHTVKVTFAGTTITIFADNVQVAHGTMTYNSTLIGGSIGFCGDPNGGGGHYHDISVTW